MRALCPVTTGPAHPRILHRPYGGIFYHQQVFYFRYRPARQGNRGEHDPR